MLEASIHEFMAARSGGELDRASLILVTREMQSPRADMPDLVVGHLRPYNEIILGCVKVLRPDLGEEEVLDHTISIFSQVTHLLNHLHILRLFRNDPEYPRDLGALARHITAFSLRGLGIPEAFPELDHGSVPARGGGPAALPGAPGRGLRPGRSPGPGPGRESPAQGCQGPGG